jgi:hypothetical protein
MRLQPIVLTLLAAALLSPLAPAQGRDRGIPAKAALERIAAKHSPKLTERIVSMSGKRGQSQPREWWIVVHDDRAPYRLRTMWVGDTRATDEGENDDFYPEQLPVGFANTAKLKIDSPAAFEILVAEASRAKVGFDSVDYKLRSIEFGDEPVWSLTARDARGRIAGRLMLSAFDGAVFRTVWYYKQPSGYPRIVDSALDGLKEPLAARREEDPKPILRETDPEVPGLEIDPLEVDPAPAAPVAPAGDPGTEEAEIEIVEP